MMKVYDNIFYYLDNMDKENFRFFISSLDNDILKSLYNGNETLVGKIFSIKRFDLIDVISEEKKDDIIRQSDLLFLFESYDKKALDIFKRYFKPKNNIKNEGMFTAAIAHKNILYIDYIFNNYILKQKDISDKKNIIETIITGDEKYYIYLYKLLDNFNFKDEDIVTYVMESIENVNILPSLIFNLLDKRVNIVKDLSIYEKALENFKSLSFYSNLIDCLYDLSLISNHNKTFDQYNFNPFYLVSLDKLDKIILNDKNINRIEVKFATSIKNRENYINIVQNIISKNKKDSKIEYCGLRYLKLLNRDLDKVKKFYENKLKPQINSNSQDVSI